MLVFFVHTINSKYGSLNFFFMTANKRIFLDMNDNKDFTSDELPDGMTIDAKGNLWIAMFQGSRIVNIDGQNGLYNKCIKYITSHTNIARFVYLQLKVNYCNQYKCQLR